MNTQKVQKEHSHSYKFYISIGFLASICTYYVSFSPLTAKNRLTLTHNLKRQP